MSILDTFLILFETDADKARREMKEVRQEGEQTADAMDKAVRHAKPLADGLGRSATAARGLGASLKGVLGLVGAIGGLALVNGLANGLNQVVEEADRLGDASARIRLSAQDFDTWRRAVKASGGEIEDAEAALASYDEMLRRIQAGIGKRGVEALAALGLTAETADGQLKDVRTSLLEVAGALEGMDRAAALRAIRRLGITDEGTIQLLLKGRAAVEALSEAQLRNGAITNEQAERINAYKDKSEQLSGILQGWKFAIVSALIPALTALNDVLISGTRWVDRNRDLVQGFGLAMLVAAGIAAAVFAPALWAAAAPLLVIAAPVIAVTAAIIALGTAFALAYEDVKAFLNGQPSLIGDLMQRYEWFRKTVNGLVTVFRAIARAAVGAFNTISGAAQTVYAVLAPLFGLLRDIAVAVFSAIARAWQRQVGRWLPVLNAVVTAIRPILDAFGMAFTAMFNLIGRAWDATIGRIVQGVNMAVNAARGLLNLPGANANGLRAAQGQLGAASASPWASATSGSVRGASNVTNTRSVGPVTVNTRATDAAGTGRAVSDSLSRVLGGAHSELADGVDR